MSFDAPLYLAALAALPVFIWLYTRRERRSTQVFAPAALMPSVVPRRAGWRRHAPVGVYGISVLVLVLALAKPHAKVRTPIEQATVVVVTDRSGSMQAKDVAPNRLEAARSAAYTFLDSVPEKVRVGAVAFNQAAQVLQAPTTEHEQVRAALAGVRAAGTTATGEAINTALALIKGARKQGRKPPPAAIVLLSDGKSVRGTDPLLAAEAAREAKVPVYTVALGTASGTIESRSANGSVRQVPVPPDPETLRQVAERSGGEAFAVSDAERLQKIYETLGSQVATELRPREITGMFAGGALLLAALAAAASLRWFGRVI